MVFVCRSALKTTVAVAIRRMNIHIALRCALIAWLLSARAVAASIFMVRYYAANVLVTFTYNNETSSLDRVAFVSSSLQASRAYFTTVRPESKISNVACRRESQIKVVTGPSGCSNLLDRGVALESSNCIASQIQLDQTRALFLTTWHYDRKSNACYLAGGGGDVRLCMGPVRLSLINHDPFAPQPDDYPTVRQLLASSGVYICSLTGPFAMAPVCFRVPMNRPGVVVNSTCSSSSYNGIFYSYGGDANDIKGTEIVLTFKNPLIPQQRLLLKRYGEFDFRIVLALTSGVEGGYDYEFTSDTQTTTTSDGTVIFQNWIEFLYMNGSYVYDMGTVTGNDVNATATFTTCTLSLNTYSPADKFSLDLTLETTVTQNDYMLNRLPYLYWTPAVCSVEYGRLDEDGNEFYPNVANGEVAGGSVKYVHPDYPNLRIFVPPNPNYHFRFDCQEVYPRDNFFLNYGTDGINGRSLTPVLNFDEKVCNFPFLDNEIVSANLNPTEKFVQCFVQGGAVADLAQTYCKRPLTTRLCQRGWLAFNQLCFYKFNPLTEISFAVQVDQGDAACARLRPDAQLVRTPPSYFTSWIANVFIYFGLDVNNFALYRLSQFDVFRCTCFDTETHELEISCPCYGVRQSEKYIFPICFYNPNTPGNEVYQSDLQVSYETAYLWTYGQQGPKFGGFAAQCQPCSAGSSGLTCFQRTCMLSTDDFENTPIIGPYFQTCYAGGRGSCFNDNPRVCQCLPQYGPASSILSSQTFLYQFRNVSCKLPQSRVVESTQFEINGALYDTVDDFVPCSSTRHGVGVASEFGTDPGICVSRSRVNFQTGEDEPAFDGKGLACPVPIIPWKSDDPNGLIIGELCSSSGICCPSGETSANPIVGDIYDVRCANMTTGCVCNPGWGGPSCTCPVPYDFAYGKTELAVNGNLSDIYIDLKELVIVQYVQLQGCEYSDLGVQTVQVSNQPNSPSLTVDCSFDQDLQLFECVNNTVARQFVILKGLNVIQCEVSVFEEMFQYCGRNETVNPRAARFLALPGYYGLYSTDLFVSTFGCINTKCFYSPNYAGKKGQVGVSSIRPVIIERENGTLESVDSQFMCGETILNPELQDAVRSRGVIDPIYNNCSCESISTVDATGRIGKVVERFTRKACECATAYNTVYKEVIECAGNGYCIEADFPYGACETDIENYLNDPLYNRFDEVTDFDTGSSVMTFTQDSFVYAMYTYTSLSPTHNPTQSPTVSPTKSPTVSPTVSPTKNPTTKMPTANPTLIGQLYMYSDNVAYPTTAIDSRAESDYLCGTTMAPSKPAGVTCRDTPALLSYSSSDEVRDFPSLYSFAPTAPVKSNSDIPVGIFSTMISGSGTVLTNSLSTAGVLPVTTYYWTGTQILGNVASQNCNGFTSVSGSDYSARGLSSSATTTWIYSVIDVCSSSNRVVCLCITDTARPTANPTTAKPTTASPTNKPTTKSPTKNPTKNPTRNPTRNPSRNPTTAKPTISGSGVLYSDSVLRNGALGNRATTTALCNGLSQKPSGCVSVTMLISYPGDEIDDFPISVGFSPTMQLQSTSAIQVAASWSAAFTPSPSPVLTNSLVTAGVFATPSPSPSLGPFLWWSGSTKTGSIATTHCNSWMSSDGLDGGQIGERSAATNSWVALGTDGFSCAETSGIVCLCVRSAALTKSPTLNPTAKPTTSKPTAKPTLPPATVVLFTSGIESDNGDLGDRAFTDDYCGALAFTPASTPGGLGFDLASLCTHIKAMLCYSGGDSIASFPSAFGFDATTSEVIALAGTLSPSYSNMISNSPTSLDVPLTAIGTTDDIWTGCTTTGATATNNCNDFSVPDNSATGGWGADEAVSGLFLRSGDTGCSNTLNVICMCIIV